MLSGLDQWRAMKATVHLWPCSFSFVFYLLSLAPSSIKLLEPETWMASLLFLSALNFPASHAASSQSPSPTYSRKSINVFQGCPCFSLLLPVMSPSTITSSLCHCKNGCPFPLFPSLLFSVCSRLFIWSDLPKDRPNHAISLLTVFHSSLVLAGEI